VELCKQCIILSIEIRTDFDDETERKRSYVSKLHSETDRRKLSKLFLQLPYCTP